MVQLENIVIREEQPQDYSAVENLTEKAFADLEISEHQEHLLVARLRNSDSFIPELSLVAEIGGNIVGHILYSRAKFIAGEKEHITLALAPLSVHPDYQKNGIGSQLVLNSFKRAKKLGYASIVIIGHPDYYPRLGCKLAADYNLLTPFDVPRECFMIYELQDGALSKLCGTLQYAPEFCI